MHRRNVLHRIARAALGATIGASFGAIVSTSATAQELWPARSLNLIVPFAPGGSTDVIARVIADAMRPILGQSVLIDNRAGAGGSTGTAGIARAEPDGYTIGMGTASTLAINPAVYRTLPYDVLRDLAPITNLAVVANIMAINPTMPARNMAEFVKAAKTQSGRISYASAGVGSVSHLMGEQFKMATSTDILHVPYRGVGPALADVVAGHVMVMYDNLPTTLPMVQSGKLRALAVSSSKRLDVLPDVPTFSELGMNELDWVAFFGLVAPAGTPEPIIRKINEAARLAMTQPDVVAKFATQQAAPIGNSPQDFAEEIKRELARHRKAAQAANIHIE
jgi:tripartite-type tricarboxylate transporter receptor subunit TctC